MSASVGLIFDVDGVIADTERVNAEVSAAMFNDRFGVANVRREDFADGLGRGAAEYICAAARVHGVIIDDATLNAAVNDRQQRFLNDLAANPLPPFPGVRQLLDTAMADSRLAVAIATSSTREKSEAVLRSAGIPYHELVYITGSDVQRKKPAPDLFTMATEGLHLPSHACVVIEDAPDGIAAAHAAGCRCVAVTNSVDANALHAADCIVDSLTMLTVADIIALTTAS